MSLISIITVNYNGFKLTLDMIDSIKKYLFVPYEIIVVDNGSIENEAEKIGKLFTEVTVVRSDKNLGFAGGNNLGIKRAKGDYIFLLNNDTYIIDDSIKYLCEFLDENSQYGAVSPKIKFASSNLVQFAGYTPLSKITIRNSMFGYKEDDKGQFDFSHETPYVHGAAVMVKRKIFEKVGFMSEIFFLYYEELDWSERIKKDGYMIGYDPKCQIFHRESSTTGVESSLKIFYMTRNRLLFSWRNRKGIVRLFSILYQICIAAPKNIVVYFIKRRQDLSVSILKGVFAFFELKNKLQH